ncbi:MAG: hypothetical protein ABH842_03700 [Candidatus Micrarchaeota archaeon]
MRLLAIVFLFIYFLSVVNGALGLTTVYDCETKRDGAGHLVYYTDSLKIKCYHSAAMTSAYIGDVGQAKVICESIWMDFGSAIAPDGSDLKKSAELESNACYYDVAKIVRDPVICQRITKKYDYNTELFGDVVNQDNCIQEVCNLAQIVPQNYYGAAVPTTTSGLCPAIANTSDNLCSVLFVLPLFFLAIWRFSN